MAEAHVSNVVRYLELDGRSTHVVVTRALSAASIIQHAPHMLNMHACRRKNSALCASDSEVPRQERKKERDAEMLVLAYA
jgi:hypothetical protein